MEILKTNLLIVGILIIGILVCVLTIGMGHFREIYIDLGAKQKSELIKEVINHCNMLGGNLVVYDALEKGLEFDCVKLVKAKYLENKSI